MLRCFLMSWTGTLCGHGPQPPGDGQVERRRLSEESQLRLLQEEMSVNSPLSASNISHFTHKSLFTRHFNDIYPASTSASSINPPPPTTSPCPSGYISWYHNCYKLVEQPATWDAAQADCRQQGGNLASIDMSYDQAFVAGVVLKGQDAWVGLRRKVLQRGWGHYLSDKCSGVYVLSEIIK